ncbi:hypothetical protein DHT93_07595 [Streptococcus australis]|nr:hypothetical protein DHT93_07595 [Streptococcus australis]
MHTFKTIYINHYFLPFFMFIIDCMFFCFLAKERRNFLHSFKPKAWGREPSQVFHPIELHIKLFFFPFSFKSCASFLGCFFTCFF